MNIDFTKPMPVPTLAKLAGVEPAVLHGPTKRAELGLVEAPRPKRGGRMAWVTGETAAIFIEESTALSAALLQLPVRK